MTTLSIDKHYLVGVKFVCWCNTNVVWGLRCFFDQIKPLLRHSCQTICLVMVRPHQGYIHQRSILFNQLCEHAELSSNKHFTCCLSSYTVLFCEGSCDPFVCTSRTYEDVQHCCFPHWHLLIQNWALQNQLASATVAPLCSSKTPVARELILTHMSSLILSMHHLPCTVSSR